MRILFVKQSMYWPRTVGHDVHAFEMMRALVGLGHDVALATASSTENQAIDGIGLAQYWALDNQDAPGSSSAGLPRLGYLESRYARYWGINLCRISQIDVLTREWRADAVVAVGLEVLPYLAIRPGPIRVWYAADEWVWHYLSQIPSDPAGTVTHLRAAAIKGLYERAFASRMDRVWVVSEPDQRAMRWVTGVRAIDVLPNGVDAARFAPLPVARGQHTAVFWGRLGFGPNVQALRWFTERVWPDVRRRVADARFTILGADPPPEVQALGDRDGITLLTNLPDLRPEISRHEVTVLPFVSGGGIKNKLLEAAAMGQPIVATPRATTGLRSAPPIVCASTPAAFADAIVALWNDPDRRARLASDVRTWVSTNHTWTQTAEAAVDGLHLSLSKVSA